MAPALICDTFDLASEHRSHNRKRNPPQPPTTVQDHHDLFRLPLELRDVVYDELYSKGFTEISRTCKLINQEATRRIYKSGILRLCSRNVNLIHALLVRRQLRDSIQNVEFRLIPDDVTHTHVIHQLFRVLGRFGGIDIHRKSCEIVVPQPFLAKPKHVIWDKISGLCGFENVLVKMTIRAEGYVPGYNTLDETAMTKLSHEQVRNYLVDILGQVVHLETEAGVSATYRVLQQPFDGHF